jgi:hypothetical protein
METYSIQDRLTEQLFAMLCASATADPTGSFENQTTASSLVKPRKKRCKGVNQFLSEITNHQPRGKRACKEVTVARMVQLNHDGNEPRGDSVAANTARWEEREDVDDDEPCKTLQNLLKKHKSVIDIGKQKMDEYVERNVSTEMHRSKSSLLV